jgi:hypothetical protein
MRSLFSPGCISENKNGLMPGSAGGPANNLGINNPGLNNHGFNDHGLKNPGLNDHGIKSIKIGLIRLP